MLTTISLEAVSARKIYILSHKFYSKVLLCSFQWKKQKKRKPLTPFENPKKGTKPHTEEIESFYQH